DATSSSSITSQPFWNTILFCVHKRSNRAMDSSNSACAARKAAAFFLNTSSSATSASSK
ncbi:hypothetical protein K456DRAFT_51662, partial [Colletotrichum gloeosporioides 23]